VSTLEFTKLHGTANDFVYVDARRGFPGDPAVLAPRLCDRHRGIGADGLILLLDSQRADCRMAIYNADGSRPEMCGNGIRGFAKFVHDARLVEADPLAVETDAGIKTIRVARQNGAVHSVAVDMGAPEWEGRRIPVAADGVVIDHPLTVGDETWRVTCVSMGNPHCVVFVDAVDSLALDRIGPAFEQHPFFPQRVNTEFVRVLGPERPAPDCRATRTVSTPPSDPTASGSASTRRATCTNSAKPRMPVPHNSRRLPAAL
jgi:diaminopimelate epimerase